MHSVILMMVFSSSLFSTELEVSDQNRKYKIKSDEKTFIYKDEATEVSLIKKKCNAHIVDRINKQVDQFLKKPFLEDSRPEFLKIKLDGKLVYEPRYGERAVFFLKMPQEIKNLKIEESLNCGKN